MVKKNHIHELAKNLGRGKLISKEIPHHKLSVEMLLQPNLTTCGPTCLHAVYRYFGDPIILEQVVDETISFDEGGTVAAWLACHAIKRGYDATIYTYDLRSFDPTWFEDGAGNSELIIEKLKKQLESKKEPSLKKVTQAYTQFLELGGELRMEDLTRDLLRGFLTKNIPIITGLNSNFLYNIARENQETNETDDVEGETTGHFVVLRGYRRENKMVYIADPYGTNPYASQKYKVQIDRVINSILLGILTYDANFLVIQPKQK